MSTIEVESNRLLTWAEYIAIENRKIGEELFSNPYFPKEFRLDFSNFSNHLLECFNEHGIYKKEEFIDQFWESKYLEVFNIHLLRELVKHGYIDLSVELIAKGQVACFKFEMPSNDQVEAA
jgi:hypothetical protein